MEQSLGILDLKTFKGNFWIQTSCINSQVLYEEVLTNCQLESQRKGDFDPYSKTVEAEKKGQDDIYFGRTVSKGF